MDTVAPLSGFQLCPLSVEDGKGQKYNDNEQAHRKIRKPKLGPGWVAQWVVGSIPSPGPCKNQPMNA